MDLDNLPEPTATASELSAAKEPWQEANDLAAQAIADIASEFVADPDPDEVVAAEGAEAEVPAETEAPAEESPAEEPKDPAEERGLSRLVEREVEIRRKEDAVNAREALIAKQEARLAELESKAANYQGDFHEHLKQSPTEALTAAGHDPDHVMRVYLAEKFKREGKPVPANLAAEIKEAESQRETAAIRRELQQFKQQQAGERFIAEIQAGARQYIEKGISKDAPTVVQVATKQPERVYREIMDEIARDAQGKAGTNTQTKVLSYEEAAKRVEARWSEFRTLLAPDSSSPAASTPVAKTPVSKAAPKGTSLTAPKPLIAKKPATQDELEKAGIEAALAEFKRIESVKKPTV